MSYKCITCGGREIICGEDPHCGEQGVFALKAAQEPYAPEQEKEVPPPYKRICIEFHKKKCPTITFEPWPEGEC